MTVRQQMKELCSCLCRQDELYATLARRHGMSFHTALTLYALDQDGAAPKNRSRKTG